MLRWLLMLFTCATVHAQQLVVMYGDEAYPPYSYVENGQFKGIYVDFLRHVSELMPDYRLELRPKPWKRALVMVKSGEALAIFPPYQFSERGFMVPYSVPLHTERVVIMCERRVMKKPRPNFPQDFADVVIGINRGFLLSDAFWHAVQDGKIKIDEAANSEVNLRKLAAGRIDCYANDQFAVQFVLRKLQLEPKAEMSLKNLDLLEAYELQQRTAHIGFSAYDNPSYKADFINQLNAAIVLGLRQQLMQQAIDAYLPSQ